MNELTVIIPAKQIRIETRLKNNILWRLIYTNFRSIKRFCEMNYLTYSSVSQLINLKKSPFYADGKYSDPVKKISNAFGLLPEEIFPMELYGFKKTLVAAEISINQVMSYQKRISELPSPEDVYIKKEAKETILKILSTLEPKEVDVVKRRFGIDCIMETLEEIAVSYNVTKERIRQVEKRALTRLRYSDRAKILKEYMDT